jgi:hypothetical protein
MYRKVGLNLLSLVESTDTASGSLENLKDMSRRFEQLNCSESSYDGYKHREIAAKKRLGGRVGDPCAVWHVTFVNYQGKFQLSQKYTTSADQFRWTDKGSHCRHLPIPERLNSIGVRLEVCE